MTESEYPDLTASKDNTFDIERVIPQFAEFAQKSLELPDAATTQISFDNGAYLERMVAFRALDGVEVRVRAEKKLGKEESMFKDKVYVEWFDPFTQIASYIELRSDKKTPFFAVTVPKFNEKQTKSWIEGECAANITDDIDIGAFNYEGDRQPTGRELTKILMSQTQLKVDNDATHKIAQYKIVAFGAKQVSNGPLGFNLPINPETSITL